MQLHIDPPRQPPSAPTLASDQTLANYPARTSNSLLEASANDGELIPLTPLQAGILFHCLTSEYDVYLQQVLIHWSEPLDEAAFVRAWEIMQTRHDSLRCTLHVSPTGEWCQAFRSTTRGPVRQLDWSAWPATEQATQHTQWLAQERASGLQLKDASLHRWTIGRLGSSEYKLLWTSHHLTLDGGSRLLLLRELFAIYDQLCLEEEITVQPAPSFAQFVHWRATQDGPAAQAYWQSCLQGFLAPTPLPLAGASALPTETVATLPHQAISRQLDETSTSSLHAFARAHELTLHTLVQGAWAALLGRYTGEAEVVFGATRACRKSALDGAAEQMIGLLINTVPVRVPLKPTLQVLEWLHGIRQQALAVRPYEHTSLTCVQNWSEFRDANLADPTRETSASLFETIVVAERGSLSALLAQTDARWLTRPIEIFEQTNYPLSCAAIAGPQLKLELEYDPRRYSAEAIERMLDHLVTILTALPAFATQSLSELPWLTAAETTQLIHTWNETAVDYSQHGDVVEQVEHFARTQPDALALEAGDKTLTYAEFNQRANQLARFLQTNGVGPGVRVGICLRRSLHLPIALLAIFKAGGAYLPLDPDYPADWLQTMVNDATPLFILTTTDAQTALAKSGAKLINCDELGATLAQYAATDLRLPIDPAALAYLMYTSGSTGRPKGVMVTRGGLKNHNLAMSIACGFTPQDRMLQFSTICFDIAVEELFCTWISGATLVFCTERMAFSAREFMQGIADLGITVINLSTTYWKEWSFAAAQQKLQLPPVARLVIVGGDKSTPEAYAAFRQFAGPQVHWINGYGPTECTVTATLYTPSLQAMNGLSEIPIGRPMPNTQAYVLDQAGYPVPIGVTGELHLGGAGVALGYWQRPDLTKKRFVPYPLPLAKLLQPTASQDQPALALPDNARLYRTGDIVRYRADGLLEFCGRRDQQAKIDGYRIEPAEIESALRAIPGVTQCVVLAQTVSPNTKQLVAYVQPAPHVTLTRNTLQAALQAVLPAYMVPNAYVLLNEFPHLPNGKLNLRALPLPGAGTTAQTSTSAKATEQALSPTEKRLQTIWQQLLNVTSIGRHENFFQLGGHSLLALRMAAEFEQTFGLPLPLSAFFRQPTIAALAAAVAQAEAPSTNAALPDCLVLLQPEGQHAPFFCVHGAGGSTNWFTEIAAQIGTDQPFYGIESPALTAATFDLNADPAHLAEKLALPKLAAAYLEAIQRVQPHGPYRIGGFSLGGLIAYEMARQLVAQGAAVSLLAILDCDSPTAMLKGWRKATTVLQRFASLPLRAKLNFIKEKLHWLTQLKTEHAITEQSVSAQQLERIKAAQIAAAYAYRPGNYDGSLLLLRAEQQHFSSPLSHDLDWSELVHGNIDVAVIPGEHYTLLSGASATALATQLRKALAQSA